MSVFFLFGEWGHSFNSFYSSLLSNSFCHFRYKCAKFVFPQFGILSFHGFRPNPQWCIFGWGDHTHHSTFHPHSGLILPFPSKFPQSLLPSSINPLSLLSSAAVFHLARQQQNSYSPHPEQLKLIKSSSFAFSFNSFSSFDCGFFLWVKVESVSRLEQKKISKPTSHTIQASIIDFALSESSSNHLSLSFFKLFQSNFTAKPILSFTFFPFALPNMTTFFPGHQRSHSQAQQLIPRQTSIEPEEPYTSAASSSSAQPYSDWPISHQSHHPTAEGQAGMRFSVLAGSDCSSSYYQLPGAANSRNDQPMDPRSLLRANLRVVIGSLALALLGSALFVFGACVMFFPNDMDVHGWVFLVVGVLFAIPGFYHVIYIGCALCGRSGYSFENLPTFTKPSSYY